MPVAIVLSVISVTVRFVAVASSYVCGKQHLWNVLAAIVMPNLIAFWQFLAEKKFEHFLLICT